MTTTTTPNKTTERPFVISRTFDAPRKKVWQAWTERERLMQWFGPKGFTMPVAKVDFRPGGTCHSCLRSPEGHEMWGKFIYREIVIEAARLLPRMHGFKLTTDMTGTSARWKGIISTRESTWMRRLRFPQENSPSKYHKD